MSMSGYSALLAWILHGMEALLAHMKTAPIDPALVEKAKSLDESYKSTADALLKSIKMPWYVNLAASTHGYLTILGYIAMAVIILSLQFR